MKNYTQSINSRNLDQIKEIGRILIKDEFINIYKLLKENGCSVARNEKISTYSMRKWLCFANFVR